MNRIGIICTDNSELELFMQRCGHLGRDKKALYTLYRGTFAGRGVAMISSGSGKLNAALAAQILIDIYNPEYVIQFGIANGVRDDVQPLDTVVCSESVFHDSNPAIYEQYPKLEEPVFRADEQLLTYARDSASRVDWKVHFGRTTTGDDLPDTCDARTLCADSGTAAAAHACHLSGVPFISIRTVSSNRADADPETVERCVHFTAELLTALIEN